jgi:hypothetical protein
VRGWLSFAGKERGSANKKSIRNENKKSEERKAADAEEEEERLAREQLKKERAAKLSRSKSVAFTAESDQEEAGDNNSSVLASIAGFLRQMPMDTLDDPEKQKPIDDMMVKVKRLAAMIHIDTGRPLHRGE